MMEFKIGDRVSFTREYKRLLKKEFEVVEIPTVVEIVDIDGVSFHNLLVRISPGIRLKWDTYTGTEHEIDHNLLGPNSLKRLDIIPEKEFKM